MHGQEKLSKYVKVSYLHGIRELVPYSTIIVI